MATLAGSDNSTWVDGFGSQSSFSYPNDVAAMASGAVVVADSYNHRIRLVSPSRNVTTLAGSGNGAWADGVGSQASFNFPRGVAVMASGAVLVADSYNHRIRLVSPLGIVTTLAGSGNPAWADGVGSQASFNNPSGVAVMASGALVVADYGNHRIRLVSPLGIVTTLAGSGRRSWADGVGLQVSFSYPRGVAVMASGAVVVADSYNHRIRLVLPLGIVTTLAGSGNPAWADGVGSQASFTAPCGVAVVASGAVLVADYGNNRIRLVSPLGIVTPLAGSGKYGVADGVGLQSSFNGPRGVAVMVSGAVVVADTFNSRICTISAISPYQSNCPLGFSGAWTYNCSVCSIGTLCPTGATIIMFRPYS